MNKISDIEPGTSVCQFTLNRGSNRFWRAHTRRETHPLTLPCEVSPPRARVPRGSCFTSWIPNREPEHMRQSMSMDFRRRARPGRKTGDILSDRTETRPEPGARRRAGTGGPEVSLAGSPESRRLTPFGAGHRPKPIRNCRSLNVNLGVDHNRVPSICVTRITGTEPNRQAAITGKNRRIKTGVCLRRLHDTGSCFATRNPLAAGRAGFRPTNRRRFHRN